MLIRVFETKQRLGETAAADAARVIREAVASQGRARIIGATGASQFEFLDALTALPDVPWAQVEFFHLDEYLGLPITHPASFRRYLLDRFLTKVPIGTVHLLDGERDPEVVRAEVGKAITAGPIDVAFVGIGENGHLAFNDPPADFETTDPYLVVDLDEACRMQQVGEGWFPSLEAVPAKALSMSVQQILASRTLLCIVPDERKAAAVQAALEGPVTPDVPASILQTHPRLTVYLDRFSSSRLSPKATPWVAD
jgi:glucosamine-6-phosphate deaminase